MVDQEAGHAGAVQHLWYGHQNAPNSSDYEHPWKAIKAVAACDGQLSDAERLYLVGKMTSIATPPDVVKKVLAFDEGSSAVGALLDGIQVPPDYRPGVGTWVVYEALSVAMADGELAEGETEAVRAAAEKMGVSADAVDALTYQVRQESSLRQRRIELLNSTIPGEFRFEHD